MSDPVPAVAEADATGETSAIFADIRAVYGVSVVNLIWRHLATFPGALPWAWGAVRPLYADGTIAREADALRAARPLPAIPRVPSDVFAALGLSADDLREIGTVLDAYERTNPMALIALSVVERQLHGTAGAISPALAESLPPPRAEPALRLPPLLDPERMAPATRGLVSRLNHIGATGDEPVVASMYRTLAHWPAHLALMWAMLAPLQRDGVLASAIARTRSLAQARAAALSSYGNAASLPEASREKVAAAIERFTGDAICRMVVICGVIRSAGLGE